MGKRAWGAERTNAGEGQAGVNSGEAGRGLRAVNLDEVAAISVGPGCLRRDLPSLDGVRTWVVDMEPGSVWPHVDVHEAGEEVYVVRGELIEDDRSYCAGTYLYFASGTQHQPRTNTGVRLIGINPK